MTFNDRERLDNFKSIMHMMYDTISVDELVASKSNKAIIRVKFRDECNKGQEKSILFEYNTATGESSEVNIKDMIRLPISNNLAVIGESLDRDSCYIEILDKDTLNIIEKTTMNISDTHKSIIGKVAKYNHTYGYEFRNAGYIGVDVPADESGEKNIHGKPINLDYTFKRIKDSAFISNIQSMIKIYDNIEDMNIINEIKLDTFGGEIEYYPIFNSKQMKTELPQVIFMYVKQNDKLYAYNFDDGQIHVVNDTRYKIEVGTFIESLNECLNTSETDRRVEFPNEYAKFKGNLDKQEEYERTQFELDCRSLENLEENKFGFNRIFCNGKCYLTLRTLLQCVKEYQRDYNGDSSIKYRFAKEPLGIPYDKRLRDIDRAVAMSLTPYKIKSMHLIDQIRSIQDKDKLGKLIITDKVVTFDELLKIEGIQ